MIDFRKFMLYFVLTCSALTGSSQTRNISGLVLNSSGISLPYVNIGIRGKQIGTISNTNGVFDLSVPDSLLNSFLTFSCVGYVDKDILISSLKSDGVKIILDTKVIQLSQVTVHSDKVKVHKLGITGRTPMTYTSTEVGTTHDIVEHARLIKLDKPARILNASIYLLYGLKDSITIRLNFYSIENDMPSKRILEKSIVKTFNINRGWLTFDLHDEDVFLDKSFVVAFEYLPSEQTGTKRYLSYGAKLGAVGSYSRKGSLGKWQKNGNGGSTIYVSAEY